MNEFSKDEVYRRNLNLAEDIIRMLRRHHIPTDCYSARTINGSNGIATQDCDIAIDFRASYIDLVKIAMRGFREEWRVEPIPNYNPDLLRLKVSLQPETKKEPSL